MEINNLTTAVLSQKTGFTTYCLKTWELRHGFPVPIKKGINSFYDENTLTKLLLVKFLRANGFKPHELLKLPIEELERMKQIVEVSDQTEKDFLLIEAKKAFGIMYSALEHTGRTISSGPREGFCEEPFTCPCCRVMDLSNEFKEWMESDHHEP